MLTWKVFQQYLPALVSLAFCLVLFILWAEAPWGDTTHEYVMQKIVLATAGMTGFAAVGFATLARRNHWLAGFMAGSILMLLVFFVVPGVSWLIGHQPIP